MVHVGDDRMMSTVRYGFVDRTSNLELQYEEMENDSSVFPGKYRLIGDKFINFASSTYHIITCKLSCVQLAFLLMGLPKRSFTPFILDWLPPTTL